MCKSVSEYWEYVKFFRCASAMLGFSVTYFLVLLRKHEVKSCKENDKLYRLQENMEQENWWKRDIFGRRFPFICCCNGVERVKRGEVCICDTLNIARVKDSQDCLCFLLSFIASSCSLP